jgi:hypothetical protein
MTIKGTMLKYRLRILNVFFPGSKKFWVKQYEIGDNSGPGSYGDLAKFKSEVVNKFVHEESISTVIEFGCGDGNQLGLADYPQYLGLDVAPGAIKLCTDKFSDDNSKSFMLFDPFYFKPGSLVLADLTLSLDVVFHLVEIEQFEIHLFHLFNTSRKWVIIYGIDEDLFFPEPYTHPRKFTTWIASRIFGWELDEVIMNRYPHGSGATSSMANFYIYKKI